LDSWFDSSTVDLLGFKQLASKLWKLWALALGEKASHQSKDADLVAGIRTIVFITLKCGHCGINDHRILEFHHLGDKDHNISNMVNHGYAWKRIEEEIVKCIPLCCNCHRLEHWSD
jgi:hypothetical protein